MKKIILTIIIISTTLQMYAQRIVPASSQQTSVVITGATIHTGNGQVIENGVLAFNNGKITYSGNASGFQTPANAKSINATGKHVYPGLIAPNTQLGLVEIEAARATNDKYEVGVYNPGVRSLTTYNTDSRAIPTLRSNGILLAETVPQGGVISGASSIMQLDAWNWEDAAYKPDNAIHLNWPSYFSYKQDDNGAMVTNNSDYEKQVSEIRQYFLLAKAYNETTNRAERNINLEAMKGLFDGSKKLIVHCDYIKEINNAVQFAASMNLQLVIMGGRDAYLCTDLLRDHQVPVILGDVHSLPGNEDDEVVLPYHTAAKLSKAGVTYCLSVNGFWQVRNLPFMAGTTVAYGVSKEDALKSITSSTAAILGIADRTGTLESGKDANVIISNGDILDMKSNQVVQAFIQGREISIDDAQKQLYEIYKTKYGLK